MGPVARNAYGVSWRGCLGTAEGSWSSFFVNVGLGVFGQELVTPVKSVPVISWTSVDETEEDCSSVVVPPM